MSVLSKTNKGEVSKPLPHDAAQLHVTGAARYVDDIPTPRDCLHLAFGLSHDCKGPHHCDEPRRGEKQPRRGRGSDR